MKCFVENTLDKTCTFQQQSKNTPSCTSDVSRVVNFSNVGVPQSFFPLLPLLQDQIMRSIFVGQNCRFSKKISFLKGKQMVLN